MSFLLKRNGNNVPLEVQRWQYFLLKQNFSQVGRADAQFGLKTEQATKFFQIQQGIAPSGELDNVTLSVAKGLGYTALSNDHYDNKKSASFPPKPGNLQSPTNASRNAALTCFKFKQLPRANRGDADEIVTTTSCNGAIADWRQTNIVEIAVPQLRFATDFHGTITCHKLVAPHVQSLFKKWEELDLLHLIRDYEGAVSPRYKRDQSPSDAGHGIKRSDQVEELSNHAFGGAFDISVEDNPFKRIPALCPLRGSVRELVPSANQLGFYWGGDFDSPKDGMHFEFADFAAP
jgi:D-alanyl-D-alanine carboxypeptidase-like protein/putative peptidoglycan binding protein